MAIDDTVFFERVKAIEEHMERLLRSFEAIDPFLAAGVTIWHPPTDVFETPDAVIIRLEIPGADPSEIDVMVEDGSLAVRGMRYDSFPEAKQSYYQMEIHYGPFERIIKLPEGLDTERATAEYAEGFLSIKIPKAIDVRPTTIRIKLSRKD